MGMTAWLIERGQPERQTPTVWWSGDTTIGWGGWTTDAWKAVRYATRATADECIHYRGWDDGRGHAVEHAFAHEDPAWLREYVVFESEDKALTVVRNSGGELQFNVGKDTDFRSADLWAEDVALLNHALSQWIAGFTSNA